MTWDEFTESLSFSQPPKALHSPLRALWWDGKGDWKAAHEVAQEIDSKEGSWIHAYLHRKEGDLPNAAYWYHQARQTMPSCSLEEEWRQLSKHFLKESHE